MMSGFVLTCWLGDFGLMVTSVWVLPPFRHGDKPIVDGLIEDELIVLPGALALFAVIYPNNATAVLSNIDTQDGNLHGSAPYLLRERHHTRCPRKGGPFHNQHVEVQQQQPLQSALLSARNGLRQIPIVFTRRVLRGLGQLFQSVATYRDLRKS
jgi:hypothetical protein